ncbi:hypothetical protein [Marinomonas sp.]
MQAPNARTKELFDGLLCLGDIQVDYVLDESVLNDQVFIYKATERVRMIGGRVETIFMALLAPPEL